MMDELDDIKMIKEAAVVDTFLFCVCMTVFTQKEIWAGILVKITRIPAQTEDEVKQKTALGFALLVCVDTPTGTTNCYI